MKDDFWPEVIRGLGLLQVVLVEVLGFSLIGVGLGFLGFKYLAFPQWGMGVGGFLGLTVGMVRLGRLNRKRSNG